MWWDSNVEGDQKLVEVLSERSIRVVDVSESRARESEGCARGSPQRSFSVGSLVQSQRTSDLEQGKARGRVEEG